MWRLLIPRAVRQGTQIWGSQIWRGASQLGLLQAHTSPWWHSSSGYRNSVELVTAQLQGSAAVLASSTYRAFASSTSSSCRSEVEEDTRPPAVQLTSRIKRAADPEELLSLVQQHWADLNHISASALFMLLKRWSTEQPGLTEQPAVQQLLQHMQQLCATEAFQAQCTTREAANIIYASSFLRWQPAFDLLLPGLFADIDEANPFDIANIVGAVVAMGQQVSQQQLQQLLAALVSKLPEADPQAIANTVLAVAKMGRQVSQQELQQLLTALVSKLPQADPQAVANTVWAVATTGQQVPQQQLQQLLAALVSKLPEAKPQHIAQTVWGVAKLEQQLPPHQLQQLLEALVSKLPEADPQAIANTVYAVVKMEQQVPQQQLQQLLTALVSKLPEAKPQHIPQTVWAVAKMEQQVPPHQLQQLLEALVSKLPEATPQNIANTVWAVAKMEQQVPQQQLQQLLAALVSKLPEAAPQAIANTVWAVAKMGQQVSPQQLQQLLAALVSKLPEANTQNIANTVWACAKLRYTPSHLLAVLDSQQRVLEQLLQAMNPQELANTAYACALLGYSNTRLPAMLLQRAVELLQRPGKQDSFTIQELCNLAWSAAVLDMQQQLPAVLKLVKACSETWASVAAEDLQQLYPVHLWLRDFQLPAAGPEGLSGCLTAQQLQDCRHRWEQQLQQKASSATASGLQHKVFRAMCELLPDSTWQQRPAMEQRTADGAYSMDIAAVTLAGVRLAIEVDGPSHFLLEPARAVGGPTACRNRVLAARGYHVVGIPFFEWDDLKTPEQQAEYLASKLCGVGSAVRRYRRVV